jgi:hypothetical protein
MDTAEIAIFERMMKAQEKIAVLLEKQQPNKVEQFISIGASIATILGIIGIIQILINFFGGK